MGMSGVLCPILVGRDDVVAELRVALDEACEGAGLAFVLLGEAGLGKSRLAADVIAEAQARRCAVLAGRAVPARASMPMRPFAEALQAAFRAGRPPDSPELRPFVPALARLVPDWRAAVAAETDLLMLAEGVIRLLRVLAGKRAALLVLEDLHWADPESLLVLEYIADNIRTEPVMCLALCRPREPTEGWRFLRNLVDRRSAQMVELSPLSPENATDMARACLGLSDLPAGLEPLIGRADGNPFLIEELLAAAIASGALVRRGGTWCIDRDPTRIIPLGFADGVRQRLASLGPAQTVVRSAAVLGRVFDRMLLGPLTGLPEPVVVNALERGVDAQLLARADAAEEGLEFRFRHALTTDAVLDELLPSARASLAARALDLLERAHPGLPGHRLETAVELAEAAGVSDRLVALLIESGRRALEQGALATAQARLERAPVNVASRQSADLDELLLQVLAAAGKTQDAIAVAGRYLATVAERQLPARRVAAAHLAVAGAAAAGSLWDEADDHLNFAHHIATEEAPELLADIHALTAEVAMGRFRLAEAREGAWTALRAADKAGLPDARCHALEILGREARVRDLDQAESYFAAALVVAQEHGLNIRRSRALHELGTIDMLGKGELDRLEQARQLAYGSGALATAATVDLQLAGGHAMRLEAENALACAKRSVEVAQRFGLGLTHAMAVARIASAHAVAGEREDMERTARQAVALADSHPDVGIAVWGFARASFALLQEDRRTALVALDEAMVWARHPECTDPGPFQHMWALLRTIAGIDSQVARDEVSSTWPSPMPLARAIMSCADAIALGQSGRVADAAARFGDASLDLHRYEELWIRHLVQRLVAEGALERGWGEPVAWLMESLAYFESRALEPPAAACRSLLRRAGAPVPRRGRGNTPVPQKLRALGVTSREVDVLVLVAKGLSNRAISERLYLSSRTVEKHVEHLMIKTDATTRSELAEIGERTPTDAATPS